MNLLHRLLTLEGRITPGVRGARLTLCDVDGAATFARVLVSGSSPGERSRSCAPADFARLYPRGEIARHLVLEDTDEAEPNSLLQTWLDAEPHECSPEEQTDDACHPPGSS